MGCSEACFIPAALALIVDYHPGPTQSRATGILMVGIMIGSGFGFIGGWIAEKHTWSTVFILLGVVGIVFSILLAFTLKDMAKKEHSGKEVAKKKMSFYLAIKSLFKLRSFILIFIAWGLMGIVAWLVVGWLPTYFLEKFKLSEGIAGFYATGFFYPAAMAGLLLGGYWADRWSRSNPRARILVQVIGIAMAAPAIFIATETGKLPLAIILFMVYALFKSFIDTNMMPALCLVVDPAYRATAYGVLNFVACIIGGVGLYAGGVLRDLNIGLTTIYQFAAIIMIIGMVLLSFVKPQVKLLNGQDSL